MQCIKKLVAIILLTFIFVFALPTVSVFADDPDMRYGRTKLDADAQYIYDCLVNGCESAQTEIDIDISGKNIDLQNDLSAIYTMFYSDYPEYFWLTGGYNALRKNNILTMKPEYSIPGNDLTAAKSKYNAKVNELTSGLKGSNYDKSKTLHDRLIDTVSYIDTPNDQNAYGALVEGKAVCNGYARAYQHLMNSVGIPAWYVIGTSTNPTTNTSIGHAWNLVKLDGAWYYTDVTWDDQGENTFYEFLNITTQKMAEGHSLEQPFASLVPQATTINANYYKKENREFTGYDQNKLIDLLKKDNKKTQIYINGDVSSFLNAVNENLLEIGKQLGATGSCHITSGASCLKNAVILNVVIISEDHTHKAQTTVPQTAATCLTNGKKAYYICDCGLKFLDSACTKQVTNDSELNIAASSHTPSDWKNDATNHWKECTKCGSITVNTRGAHTDTNKDNKCDTCGYQLPVADQSGNIIVGDGTSGNITNNDQNKLPSNQTNTSSNTTSSENNTPVDNSSSQDETVNIDAPSLDSSTEQSSDAEELYLYQNTKPDNSIIKQIVICVAVAFLVTAITVVTVILIKKNK